MAVQGRGALSSRGLHEPHGPVVEQGTQSGVPTPANHILTEILLDLVEGRVAHDQFRDRPEQLIQRAVEAGVPGLG